MSESVSRTTILDIARELNVAAATVSRALNDHPAISDATREAVKLAAQRMNYQPTKFTTSLRPGRSKIIGVIIPSAEINFFGSVIHGIEKIASKRDYHVLIYQSNELYEMEKKGVQTFLRSRVEGVLASLSKETINLAHFSGLKAKGVPLVLFDRAHDALQVPAVVVNDYLGAFHATRHLIVQGCSRIAHIGGQQHVTNFNQRLRGYIDALNVHNIAVDDDLIVYGKVSIESGRECMKSLLPKQPDAVFAVEDFTALGAMQAIKDAGLRIPADIALIGFANELFSQYLTPSLSTVNQHTVQMGEQAAGLFFDLLHKKNSLKNPPRKLILEPEIICRQSSNLKGLR